MDTISSWIRRIATALASPNSRTATRETSSTDQPLRNYTQERETTRTGNLNVEDQAWEADRLRRNQEGQPGNQPPAEPE